MPCCVYGRINHYRYVYSYETVPKCIRYHSAVCTSLRMTPGRMKAVSLSVDVRQRQDSSEILKPSHHYWRYPRERCYRNSSSGRTVTLVNRVIVQGNSRSSARTRPYARQKNNVWWLDTHFEHPAINSIQTFSKFSILSLNWVLTVVMRFIPARYI